MNCLKNQRERFTTTESWSPPPHVEYQPLRVSRSVAHSNLHSVDNSPFSRGFSNECRPLPTAGGFFSLDDDDNDYLLENSQVLMDSTVQCLCKRGHKQLEVSYPRRSRSFLGYLPEVEEEMSIPFPRDLHGSSTIPLDENFCYAHTRAESNSKFIYSNPSSLGLETSRGVPYFSNADGNFQRPRLEEEILGNSSLSRCTLGQTRHRAERKMLLSTPEKFRYNGGISFDPMSTFRNLRYEGTHSPGHEVQSHNRQGTLVTSIIRPKQAIGNSSSEMPPSSSVSVSSDETEHPQLKVGLYKTELCRSWEETAFCRYGAKCQFAHGYDDLRPVPRHPKYKTELCRSFTDTGLCSYGKRCRFVHSSNTPMQTSSRSSDLEKTSSRRLSIFQQLCGAVSTPYWITSTKSTAFSLIPIYMNLFQTDAGAFREPKNI